MCCSSGNLPSDCTALANSRIELRNSNAVGPRVLQRPDEEIGIRVGPPDLRRDRYRQFFKSIHQRQEYSTEYLHSAQLTDAARSNMAFPKYRTLNRVVVAIQARNASGCLGPSITGKRWYDL